MASGELDIPMGHVWKVTDRKCGVQANMILWRFSQSWDSDEAVYIKEGNTSKEKGRTHAGFRLETDYIAAECYFQTKESMNAWAILEAVNVQQ